MLKVLYVFTALTGVQLVRALAQRRWRRALARALQMSADVLIIMDVRAHTLPDPEAVAESVDQGLREQQARDRGFLDRLDRRDS